MQLYKNDKISSYLYKTLRSSDSVLPKIYGLPKIHKPNVPLRPIVSVIGTATYLLAKFLKQILVPLVGNTQYTVKNSSKFVELISSIKVGKSESQVWFDEVSLFTSVPLKTAKTTVANRVGDDCTLRERTSPTVSELTKALDICLQSSFFVYNDVIYKQIFGSPIGSPLSTIIANMFMEEIEQTASNTYLKPPSLRVRYVDDSYAMMEKTEVKLFYDCLNTVSTSIKFTNKLEKSGQLAFLDISVQQMEDGSLATSVYRKPTHTDRYLQYTSYHPVNQKVCVALTLFSTANRITSNNEKKVEEFHQIIKTLQNNGFPNSKCSFKKYLQNHNIRKTEKLKRFTSIPYVQGVSYSISRILTKVGIAVALTPHQTLSSLLRKRKDPINFEQKRGLMYQISCRDCNAVYVGETGRSVRTRKREHVDAVKTFNTKMSTLSQRVVDFDNRMDWDNVKILKSESHTYRRRVADSFLINQKACSCNVINHNNGANFPAVYSVFVSNK